MATILDRSVPIRVWALGTAARRICGTLLAVIAAVLLYQTWYRAHRPDGSDFTSFLQSARALVESRNPYTLQTPYPYAYPLFLALMLTPLRALPYGAGVIIWFTLNALALGVALAALSSRTVMDVELLAPARFVPAALAVLILLPVVQSDLLNGQINLLVLAACVLSLVCLLAGKPSMSAGLWALAMTLKLVPVILVLFFVVRRQGRLVAAGLAVSVVLCLLPLVVAGPVVFSWYAGYAKALMSGTYLGVVRPPLRYSLMGIMSTYFPAISGSAAVRVMVPLLAVVAVAALDLRGSRGKRATAWAFALYLLTILLVSPVSETHHLAFAIPAVYLGISELFECGFGSGPRQLALAGAACAFWLGQIVSRFRSELWFATLVLLAAVAISGMFTAAREQPAESRRNRQIITAAGD